MEGRNPRRYSTRRGNNGEWCHSDEAGVSHQRSEARPPEWRGNFYIQKEDANFLVLTVIYTADIQRTEMDHVRIGCAGGVQCVRSGPSPQPQQVC